MATGLLTACGGGPGFPLGHVEAVEIEGFQFPAVIGDYTLLRCKALQDDMNAGSPPIADSIRESLNLPTRRIMALYISSDFMRQANMKSEDCPAESAEPPGIPVSVMRFESPEKAHQFAFQALRKVPTAGKSECNESGRSLHCSCINGATIAESHGAAELKSKPMDMPGNSGYRLPTMDELAKVAEAIAAAQ